MEKQELQRLTTLKNIFPEESWSWAITALKRNPVIWKQLDSADFSQGLIDELGTDPTAWTPARISAVQLKAAGKEEITLPVRSFDDISAEMKGVVHQTYQDFNQEQGSTPDLSGGILLALGLLAERNAGKSWEEILEGYSQRFQWLGPLKVLSSLIEKPSDFLRALDPDLAIEVLLANPISPEALADNLVELVANLDLSELEKWLKAIEREVPDLAAPVARALLSSLDLAPKSIPEILALAQLNQLAGNQSQALQLLEKAAQKNQQIQGKLTANLNKVKTYLDEPQVSDPAWQELKKSLRHLEDTPENIPEIAEIIHSLLEKKQFAAVADLVGYLPDPLPEDPDLLVVLAEFARTQQQPNRAEQLARKTLQIADGSPPERLSSIFFELGCYEESRLAAASYLEKHPNHLPSHLNQIESLRRRGNYNQAAKAAQILTVLAPGDLALQRKLADYLEDAESWSEALEIRANILTKSGSSPAGGALSKAILPREDLQAFAECAYQAGHYNRTISACNQVLAQDEDNSLALGLKGKSLCSLEKHEEGFAHLNRAVELNPALEGSWLTLAECQLKGKSIDKALQTLKSGLTASATKAHLYALLGRIESRQRNHTRALETYQKAAAAGEAEGTDQKTTTAIELGIGEAYYQLGHTEEARQILHDLNQRYPANQEANYLYGKLLLEEDQPAEALPYLVQVVDKKPADPQAYLLYADALLRLGDREGNASEALSKALELDPDNQIARVLLAESQAACGDYKKAALSFQRARESALMIDPVWAPRISIGLGTAALKLGETETAIAALKDGQDRYPSDLRLTHHLAQAYQEANLIDNALETARQAAEIAPRDGNNLAWIARFTLGLGRPEEGISALKNLITLDPDQPSAFLQLGKAQAAAGNHQESAAAFSTLVDFEEIQPEDLLTAGDELIKLGELETGLASLSKAITICEANPEPSPLLPSIWSRQAAGYELLDDHQTALELLDKAISAELDEPAWRIQKADLLIKGGRYQAAIASLENALELAPDQPALHAKLARVQRQINAFEDAFFHAQEAFAGALSHPDDIADLEAARALAVDLALATLRQDAADELLADFKGSGEFAGEDLPEGRIITLCLAAESALDREEEVKAAEIYSYLADRDTGHPRFEALRSRILSRQGELEDARESYRQAVENWKKTPPNERQFTSGMEIALAKSALDIQNWEHAASHLQHAVDSAPREKRALLALAKGYIELAETRRLYETLKSIQNAPSPISLSGDVHKSLEACLKVLRELDCQPSWIDTLSARGNAIFAPNQEHAEKLQSLAESPQELAAAIAAFRHSRQKVFAAQEAANALSQLGQVPQLDAQISLALQKINPDDAFKAAASALETCKRMSPAQLPLYYALLAQAASGVGDTLSAEDAISKALQIWEEEPRWYALAAEITGDYSQAVAHYQKAIQLEPAYTGHYLALGEIHLKARQTLPAVKSFEKALELNPELVDGWILRAMAKRSQQRMPEALASIDQALALAPEHKEARKTAALLTFENGKYRESEAHLVTLLGQEPNDTELLALFARTLTAQKQSEQAMRVIEKAIALEEDSLELKLERAAMVKQIHGPHAAVDELRIIGSSFPEEYKLINELVTTLAEAGEMDEAIRTALEALGNKEIGHTKEQKAHLYLTTGKLLRNNGQLDQAVHHLHQAKKLIDPNYEAVLELGRVHFDRRQYDLALSKIQEAIQIEPDEAEGYYQAGRVLKELRQYSQAEKMLRKASKLAPNDLKVHRQLGVLVTLNLVHGEPKPGVPVG